MRITESRTGRLKGSGIFRILKFRKFFISVVYGENDRLEKIIWPLWRLQKTFGLDSANMLLDESGSAFFELTCFSQRNV